MNLTCPLGFHDWRCTADRHVVSCGTCGKRRSTRESLIGIEHSWQCAPEGQRRCVRCNLRVDASLLANVPYSHDYHPLGCTQRCACGAEYECHSYVTDNDTHVRISSTSAARMATSFA